MSEVTKAVITDETAREILQEMQVANATSRETRNLMSEQAEAMRKISEHVGGSAASGVFYVPATYDGTEYALDGVTFDEVLAAYEEGKQPVLKIAHEDDLYFARMINFTYNATSSKITRYFQFYSHFSPDGSAGALFSVRHETQISTGVISKRFMFSPSGVYASAVVCDVSIGGTPYRTLDAALSAIAAALG